LQIGKLRVFIIFHLMRLAHLSPVLLAMSLVSCGTFKQRFALSTDGEKLADDMLTGTYGIARTLTRATALASVRQPATSAKVGAALAWQRPTEVIRGNLPEWFASRPLAGRRPGGVAFERLLDEKGFAPEWAGDLKPLVDGREFFPAFREAVQNAENEVAMQFFIFDNDDIAVAQGDLLRKRSQEVRVRVLFDDLGSAMATRVAPETSPPAGFFPPEDMAKYLAEGRPLSARKTLNPWLLADHTKLITIDDDIAFVGGMNIGREYYSEWHDLMVTVKGPVIASLQHHFEDNWRRAGFWGDFARNPEPPALVPSEKASTGVRVLKTDIAQNDLSILRALIFAIRASQDRIWIETPYFSSDELARALIAAKKRGVDVRLILPDSCNSGVMHTANFVTAGSLMKHGIKVYRYPGMTHLKATLCDGWAMVGSANLDTLSLRVNSELNLASGERAFVNAMASRVFQADFAESRRMTQADVNEVKSNPLSPLMESIADQL
jgi:cardiolipin synthase